MGGEYVFKQIIECWGVSKTIQVAIFALVGASVGVAITANIIPNEPKLIEKENE